MEIEYIYLLFFTFIIVIWIIGEWKKDTILKSIVGMLLAAIGIYTFINGISGVTTSLTWFEPGHSYAWVFYSSILITFLGIFLLLTESYGSVWGTKESEEEEDD